MISLSDEPSGPSLNHEKGAALATKIVNEWSNQVMGKYPLTLALAKLGTAIAAGVGDLLDEASRQATPGVTTPGVFNSSAIDTSNQFMVGLRLHDMKIVMRMPLTKAFQFGIESCNVALSADEALNMSAWMRVIADPKGSLFETMVRSIKST